MRRQRHPSPTLGKVAVAGGAVAVIVLGYHLWQNGATPPAAPPAPASVGPAAPIGNPGDPGYLAAAPSQA